MTRSPRPGDPIIVKPANDVYTGLAAAACVVMILGLIALFTRSNAVFGDGLFFPSGNTPGASTR